MKNSRSVTTLLGQGYRNFLDLLYPRRCPLCHRILNDRHGLLCPDCARDIQPITGARCYKCGKPVKEEEEYCWDCQKHPGAFDQGRGIFLYDDRMKYSIMKYKYFGCREYSRFYGKAMYLYGKSMLSQWKPQVIVPVPLHWKKMRSRGFNQAELLARELSRYTGISVNTRMLKKCHTTRSQKKLDAAQRRKNLQEAFTVIGNPEGMRILLIDDVYTTGSTMDVLSRALLEKGAANVFFLTLCIGRNR
ncbi:MAG: ComF family protein [Clostridia bacterium]|nr:ComF family protein [Clostridia bacterium]